MSIIDDYIADHPDMSSRDVAAMVGCSKSHVNDVRRRMQKNQTAVILGDIHAPYHDPTALGIALEHALEVNPDVLIVNGDFADFYQISKWKNDPKRMPYDEEREIAREMLADIGEMFPDARKVFIVGNHELRLERLCWSGSAKQLGSRLTLETELGIAAAGFEKHDNIKLLSAGKQPFSIGGVYIIHGHEVRVSVGAINPAKLFYEKTRVNVIASHCHRTHEHAAKKHNGCYDWGYTTGCLCHLSEPYAPINDWCHGFAVVNLFHDGAFHVKNHRIIQGRLQ